MTNIESLRSLQKRIREAKGPDRKLDLAICETFNQRMSWSGDIEGLGSLPYTLDPDGLGPCVALMLSALPEHTWSREPDGAVYVWKTLYGKPFMIAGGQYEPIANDCLTFLDAIFSAAIAQEEAKEKADV